jgi:hypothetical protein
MIMNNNEYSLLDKSIASTTSTAISSSPYASHSSTKSYQNYYYNEYHEGIVEIASSLMNILLNQMVDNTTVATMNADVKEE